MREEKFRVGIVGATGYVGQTFVTLLADHPWFEIKQLFASARSAGKNYQEAVKERWHLATPMPAKAANYLVQDLAKIDEFKDELDFVFCAVNMPKAEVLALEEKIARLEIPVVSNNSANRQTADVPMVIPEINADHLRLIEKQRQRLGTKYGFIVAKPNCSIQSYVPLLHPLRQYEPELVSVCTYQAISGAGKTFNTWPEMQGNVIPFIGGEETKSEEEPLKIWADLITKDTCSENKETELYLELAQKPIISAQCYRVAVQDGHTAAVSVKFKHKPTKEQMIEAWQNYQGIPQKANLPSAPKQFITYFAEDDRPQAKTDAQIEKGMGISVGRLREDKIFDYKFVGLSHNTLRGAAGGAVLTAELLVHLDYLKHKYIQ